MTSNPPAVQHLDGQVPGTSAPAVCKRPGCGNALPGQDRGRTRQFCGDECARRYHNDARVPAPAAAVPADSSADPLAALDAVIRQAAVLTRAARDMAAGLDPARVRAQVAAAQAEAAGQATAARAEAARCARERDDATQAARRADAEVARARQAEADARAETDRVRADAARERGTLREQHQAQLDAVAALTEAERARAERAEAQLEAERADRRHLASALTAPASPASGNGKLPRAAAGKGDQQ